MIASLEHKLKKRKKSGNFRELRLSEKLIDFASNDYLGLARSQQLVQLVFQEWEKNEKFLNGLGSTGSRLLTANSSYIQELEDNIAVFHGYEAGLLFNCGYMANVGLLSAIANNEDSIFFDAHVHASTHDGIRLSRANAFPFRHNDVEHLENRLKNSSTRGNRIVCIESIYSTDGSLSPIQEICLLSRKYDAQLIVDEAHAIGVCGTNGRGIIAKYGLMQHVFAQINTFGKALGVYGAIVLGNNILKQVLINFARSLIYATALPFLSLAAIKCSYSVFPMLENERLHLRNLIQIFRKAHLNHSETHIQSVEIKGNYFVQHVAKQLAKEGFDVRSLMSPTVQKGHEVLRICLHAFNSEQEILALLEHIDRYRSSGA